MYRRIIICIILTLMALATPVIATPVIASNPRVLQASNPTPNNVILFYDDYPTRGDPNFQVTPTIAQPLVTYVDQNGKSTDWMFDSFIFYSYSLYFEANPTQQYINSWTSYLFDGMQVAKLDASVGNAKAALNQPSYQMMVFLSIPVAVNNVTVPSILNNINSLDNRWNNLGPSNLKLVGFYWGFTEDTSSVPNLQNIIPQVASYVHSLGLKMLMIPYQNPGTYAQLHSLGFDYVTLQPNYAWDSSDDLTLFTKTNDAITAGYVNGIELEVPLSVTCCGRNWLTNLQTYLQQANQYQWYAKQPTVYYHGSDISVMARSSNSTDRAAYDMIYQYVLSTRTAASTNSTSTTTTSASTNTTTQSAPLNSLVTGVDAGSGSVSPNCPSGCQQQVGSSVLVSAAATSGWTFSSWTVTGASCSGGPSSNPCTFTMPNNAVTLSATFTQITASSTTSSVSSSTSIVAAQMFTAVGSGQGSVTPNCPNGCSEAVGSQVTVSANPSSGWQFSSWSTQNGQSCSSNPCTFNMPNQQVTLTATFTQDPPSTQTLTTSVGSGQGTVNPNCPAPSSCQGTVGQTITVTGTASSGWEFSSWSVTGASCSGGPSSNPCQFTMPNSGVSVSATFTDPQTLITSVDAGSGSVLPNCPSGCSEAVGPSITVQANPSSGWQFSSWSTQAGISCSTNPCTFSMPSNAVTLKATFTQLTQTSTQSSINGGETVTVTQSSPPTTITNSVTVTQTVLQTPSSTQSAPNQYVTVTQNPPPIIVTQFVTQVQTVTQTLLASNPVNAGTGSSPKVSTTTLRASTNTVEKRERNAFYLPEFQDLSQWWTAILLMLSGAWLALRFPRYRTGGLAIISKLTKVSGRATSKP